MEPISLDELVDELFERARQSHSGRAAHNLLAGREHPLSQTVIAIVAGHGLGEHDSPGEATLQLLRGRVRFAAVSDSCDLPPATSCRSRPSGTPSTPTRTPSCC